MSDDYGDIQEVVTAGRKIANRLLAGYRLLAVSNETRWEKKPGTDDPLNGFVKRSMFFVLGRPAGVEHVEPWKKRPEEQTP